MACYLSPYGRYASSGQCADADICGACPPPFEGDWYLHRSSGAKVQAPFQSFRFVQDSVDTDGFQWYYSTALHGNTPLVQIGVKDTKTSATRRIEFKVKGHIKYGNADARVWSQGSYDNPGAHVVASWSEPGYRECFIMDAVDLGKICGAADSCMLHAGGRISTLILQRVSVCGDDRMNTAAGTQPYGEIETYACNNILE